MASKLDVRGEPWRRPFPRRGPSGDLDRSARQRRRFALPVTNAIAIRGLHVVAPPGFWFLVVCCLYPIGQNRAKKISRQIREQFLRLRSRHGWCRPAARPNHVRIPTTSAKAARLACLAVSYRFGSSPRDFASSIRIDARPAWAGQRLQPDDFPHLTVVRRELEARSSRKTARGSLLADRLFDDFVQMPAQRLKGAIRSRELEAAGNGSPVFIRRFRQDLALAAEGRIEAAHTDAHRFQQGGHGTRLIAALPEQAACPAGLHHDRIAFPRASGVSTVGL